MGGSWGGGGIPMTNQVMVMRMNLQDIHQERELVLVAIKEGFLLL